jgi:hypothetical protein
MFLKTQELQQRVQGVGGSPDGDGRHECVASVAALVCWALRNGQKRRFF